MLPRLDHEITETEHRLLRIIPFAPQLVRALLYAVMEVRVIGFRRPWMMRLADRVARWHLRRQVPDPQLRKKLTPGYVMGCKRILISDDYYPSLTRPNTEVITDGVKEVRAGSVVTADGRSIDVDTIIFGTGFHVTDPQVATRIRGRDGRRLSELWNPTMGAYKGTTVAGFPNLFILLGPNTGLGHNSQIHIIESQLNYVCAALRAMRSRGAETAEVRPEAQRAYNERVQAAFGGTVWTAGHCESWYLDETGRNTTIWPDWTWRFRLQTRRFDPEAYTLREVAGEHAWQAGAGTSLFHAHADRDPQTPTIGARGSLHADYADADAWLRRGVAVLCQLVEVERDRRANLAFGLFPRIADGVDRQIRSPSAPTPVTRLLIDDSVVRHRSSFISNRHRPDFATGLRHRLALARELFEMESDGGADLELGGLLRIGANGKHW